jgi:hypothetical protein
MDDRENDTLVILANSRWANQGLLSTVANLDEKLARF